MAAKLKETRKVGTAAENSTASAAVVQYSKVPRLIERSVCESNLDSAISDAMGDDRNMISLMGWIASIISIARTMAVMSSTRYSYVSFRWGTWSGERAELWILQRLLEKG